MSNHRLVVLGLALLAWLSPSYAAEPTYSAEGILLVGEFFGSPGYGEDRTEDELERSFYLQLPAPLATQLKNPPKDQELGNLQEYFLQLVITDKVRAQADQLVGAKVQVDGSLFTAHTGHHRTTMLMDVQSLNAISSW